MTHFTVEPQIEPQHASRIKDKVAFSVSGFTSSAHAGHAQLLLRQH